MKILLLATKTCDVIFNYNPVVTCQSMDAMMRGGSSAEGKSALCSSSTSSSPPTSVMVYRRVLSTSDAVSPSGARITVTRSHSLGSAADVTSSPPLGTVTPPGGDLDSVFNGGRSADPSPPASFTAPWRVRSAYRSNRQ